MHNGHGYAQKLHEGGAVTVKIGVVSDSRAGLRHHQGADAQSQSTLLWMCGRLSGPKPQVKFMHMRLFDGYPNWYNNPLLYGIHELIQPGR